MAGEAKTTKFMLGSATVLVGPQANLWNLTPAANAIGLVKNFTISSEPAYTELSQGTKNTMIYSVMTSNTVKAQMEVYEYTSQNLTYSLGLDGSAVVPQTVAILTSAASAATNATVFTFATLGELSAFAIGDWVIVQNGTDDQVFVRKVSAKTAISPFTLTLSTAVPNTTALPIGTAIRKVNAVDIGSKNDQPFLSAVIIGELADGTEIRMMIPKMRITNGFTLGFATDNYGNLPFEFSLYDLVPGDALFAEFAGKQAILFTRT